MTKDVSNLLNHMNYIQGMIEMISQKILNLSILIPLKNVGQYEKLMKNLFMVTTHTNASGSVNQESFQSLPKFQKNLCKNYRKYAHLKISTTLTITK